MLVTPPARSDPHPPLRPGRAALALAPAVILGRGAAFAVPLVVTWTFGAAPTTDAWFAALSVPTAVLVVVGNAIGLAATPLLGGHPARFRAELGRVQRAGLRWTALAGAPALAALALGCRFAPGIDPVLARLAPLLALALAPWLAVVATIAALRPAVELKGHFYASALAPLARAACTGALVLAAGPRAYWLPAAWTAGALAELAVLGAALGPLPPGGAAAAEPIGGIGPLVAGEAMVAANLVVDRSFAAGLGPGTLTVLELADRVRLIPQTLVDSTFFRVVFAAWARLAAGDRAVLDAAVCAGLRALACFSAPILAFLWIGRHPLLGLLARGALAPGDASDAAAILAGYLPGLWAMSIGALALRANVLLGRARAVGWLGAWSFAANLLGNTLLAPLLGAPGLAIATSAVWTTVAAWHLGLLHATLAAGRPSAWIAVLGLVACAVAVALAAGSPRSFADPSLWLGWTGTAVLAGAAALRNRGDR
jgi:putative peptidoglycan lipid II flippase